jgi:hypothetical protein
MKALTRYSQRTLTKFEIQRADVIDNVRHFLKEETSASETSEEGVLTYVVIMMIFVSGAIIAPNAREIMTSLSGMFQSGTAN